MTKKNETVEEPETGEVAQQEATQEDVNNIPQEMKVRYENGRWITADGCIFNTQLKAEEHVNNIN